MDYKEKYEQALERAKKLHEEAKFNEYTSDMEDYETIFPELKESEDEKIRKNCIHFLNLQKQHHASTIEIDECIAWLEKQGTPAKLNEEEQNRFAKGVLTSCAMSFINYLDAHKYEGKMCVSNGECEDIENAFQNAMWDRLHRYYCKYIEKQGEQEETLCDECKKEQPSHSCQDITALGRCALEKKGEKKPEYPLAHEKMKTERWKEACKAACSDRNYRSHYGLTETRDDYFVDGVQWADEHPKQKPEWSEEDEKNIDRIKKIIHCYPGTVQEENYLVNWLKSLRTQKQWKPTEEQIEALTDIINLLASSPAPHCKDYFIIKELKEQLKNLV